MHNCQTLLQYLIYIMIHVYGYRSSTMWDMIVLWFYKCSEYRAWIVGEKTDFRKVNVFFVDYGNTSTLDRRMTSLTSPYIWETKPILQPFTISGNAQIHIYVSIFLRSKLQGHLFGVLCLSVCLPAYLYDCMIFNCLIHCISLCMFT